VTKGISSGSTGIKPSYDLTSDHSPIIATISTSIITRKPTPRLRNSKTNWETYRQTIQEKAKLSTKLKDHEQVELETNIPINMLQNAAKKATPSSEPHSATNNVPYEIKTLIAEKRKARSTWQRTHTPDNNRKYNQINNKLKSKLHELRNESFKAHVSSLKREDSSIWRPIKNRRKPTESQPPIRKNTIPPGPWAKSDKEKADLFAEHLSEVFTPHNNHQNQKVEQELEIPIQQQDRLKPLTLKEIKNEIKKLNHKKAP